MCESATVSFIFWNGLSIFYLRGELTLSQGGCPEDSKRALEESSEREYWKRVFKESFRRMFSNRVIIVRSQREFAQRVVKIIPKVNHQREL